MNLVQEFNDLNRSDLFINLEFMKSVYVYLENFFNSIFKSPFPFINL
jgi:hypothetical protein